VELRKLLKLSLLSVFDVCHERCRFDFSKAVYTSGRLKLFKCLMSSKCLFDCRYCYNPWHRGEMLTPQEFAKAFFLLKEKGLTDSVFISSGIYSDPEKVMDDIIEAGRLIRKNFSGYMHLKIIPGASRDQIREAAKIANRISINAEVAKESMLGEICSVKSKLDIRRRANWISKEARKHGISHTTQIVVGLGENDLDVLNFMEKWYSRGVSRIYFSPFRPLKGTPYENRRRESKKRIVNLYRADWLIRKYDVDISKLKAVAGERFECDPKVLLALNFGIKELTDIPGIGFKAAKLMNHDIRNITNGTNIIRLKKMGFNVKKISAFLPGQKRLSEWI